MNSFYGAASGTLPGSHPRYPLAIAREGDALVVTKLDRLARSINDLWSIIDRLKARGVALRVLNLGIDTGNATAS
jgi:DNA invertase Pin-like site-specific DNA recombinase